MYVYRIIRNTIDIYIYIYVFLYMYCNYPNIICLQEECNDEEELR